MKIIKFLLYKSHSYSPRMAISLILIILSTSLFAQTGKVSISKKNVTILSIFEEIEKQTNLTIAYNESKLDVNRRTTVNLNNQTPQEALTQVLQGSGFTYSITGKQVVIIPEKTQQTPGEIKKIKGVVADKSGEPLIGVSVTIAGTSTGTVTNMDGVFELSLTDPNAMLSFSYIGYKTEQLSVKNKSTINVTMSDDAHAIDEVVVVGYGSQKKVNLTGAVTSVKMEDVLGSRPVSSSIQALEGAIPGLQINRANGKPGTADFINMRGVTSINNPEQGPLVLIDHVPMDLSMVDPNDIESVSVLKDAAAAAIYGARAAFGIILITTKKASKDSPIRVNYSNNFAFSKAATLPNTIDPYSTVRVYNDLGIESYFGGQSVSKWLGFMDEYNNQGKYGEGFAVDNGIRYNLARTDVYKDMMDKYGFQQQHNLSLSGGTNKSTYRIAFGMVNEDGVLISDQDAYKRYNASAFISLDATDWLTGQMDIRYSDANTSTPQGYSEGSNFWNHAANYQPMAPLGYGKDKTTGDPLPYGSPRNMILLEKPKINRENNTRVLGRLILKPFKGMEITGEYSFYRQWWSENFSRKNYFILYPVSGATVSSLSNNPTYYSMDQGFSTNNAINIYGTYKRSFAEKHNFTLMGGFNQESYYYETLYGKKEGLLVQELPSLSLADGIQTVDDGFQEYAVRGAFYRLNYDYKGKYLLEVNGRYDGSSRFPKNKRFGFFPSFSAGWRVSEEAFFEPVKEVVSSLKFRGSWGQIGNQNVSYYGYLPSMSSNKPAWILPGGTDFVTSMAPPGLVSNNYTWETVQTLDFGIDASFLKNRLNVIFDWYQRDTKNMLAPVKAGPVVLGAGYPNENSAALQTKGFELSLQWSDRIGKDISYNIGVNLYDSKSVITKYDNPSGLLINDGSLYLREGMTYGEIWGYTTDRFYTADDFENGVLKKGIPFVRGVRPNPGDVLYKNLDGEDKATGNYIIDSGENTFNNPGDMKIIGNNTARYQFGFNGSISWKNFDFSFMFSGVGKRDMIMPSYAPPSGTFVTSVFDFQTDYWKEGNENAYWPRIYGIVPSGVDNNGGANTRIQTKYLQDASYIRLKNLTLGYSLPKSICNKASIQNLRIFASGENLYTWHHLPTGFYPDSYVAVPGMLNMSQGIRGDSGSGNWSYPLMRQVSFGINLVF